MRIDMIKIDRSLFTDTFVESLIEASAARLENLHDLSLDTNTQTYDNIAIS